MAVLYRVRDWSKHFECNRTRELKTMTFVTLPTKQDGDGYSALVEHEDGAAHYGCWCALLCIAAKCSPRGTLLRDATTPHDAASLSRKSRIAVRHFRSALPRFVEIGWLESITVEAPEAAATGAVNGEIPHPPAGFPHQPAEKPQRPAGSRAHAEGTGREGKGPEGNRPEGTRVAAPLWGTTPAAAELVDAWNAAEGTRKVRALSKGRRSRLLARLADKAWPWREALAKFPLPCCASDPDGWQPDFDWFLRPDSATRIVEGKYDWTKGTRPKPQRVLLGPED
jgi:hypothetical protein